MPLVIGVEGFEQALAARPNLVAILMRLARDGMQAEVDRFQRWAFYMGAMIHAGAVGSGNALQRNRWAAPAAAGKLATLIEYRFAADEAQRGFILSRVASQHIAANVCAEVPELQGAMVTVEFVDAEAIAAIEEVQNRDILARTPATLH